MLEQPGLVTRMGPGHRSRYPLEANVFDLMTSWIDRYERAAEERFRRLDAVLSQDERRRADRDRGAGAMSHIVAPDAAIEADPGVAAVRVCRDFACMSRSGLGVGVNDGHEKQEELVADGAL